MFDSVFPRTVMYYYTPPRTYTIRFLSKIHYLYLNIYFNLEKRIKYYNFCAYSKNSTVELLVNKEF